MTNVITSCQIQRLAALQQELGPMGMTINVELMSSGTADTAAIPRKKRKYSRRTKSTDPTSPQPPTATTTKKKTRKMTSVGTAAIQKASTQYHARIRELRETEGLTLKQARKHYQMLKAQ
jgi:ribosome-binding protein aMBF1 (putative translation factor)